jgi:hypothetical protein
MKDVLDAIVVRLVARVGVVVVADVDRARRRPALRLAIHAILVPRKRRPLAVGVALVRKPVVKVVVPRLAKVLDRNAREHAVDVKRRVKKRAARHQIGRRDLKRRNLVDHRLHRAVRLLRIDEAVRLAAHRRLVALDRREAAAVRQLLKRARSVGALVAGKALRLEERADRFARAIDAAVVELLVHRLDELALAVRHVDHVAKVLLVDVGAHEAPVGHLGAGRLVELVAERRLVHRAALKHLLQHDRLATVLRVVRRHVPAPAGRAKVAGWRRVRIRGGVERHAVLAIVATALEARRDVGHLAFVHEHGGHLGAPQRVELAARASRRLSRRLQIRPSIGANVEKVGRRLVRRRRRRVKVGVVAHRVGGARRDVHGGGIAHHVLDTVAHNRLRRLRRQRAAEARLDERHGGARDARQAVTCARRRRCRGGERRDDDAAPTTARTARLIRLDGKLPAIGEHHRRRELGDVLGVGRDAHVAERPHQRLDQRAVKEDAVRRLAVVLRHNPERNAIQSTRASERQLGAAHVGGGGHHVHRHVDLAVANNRERCGVERHRRAGHRRIRRRRAVAASDNVAKIGSSIT